MINKRLTVWVKTWVVKIMKSSMKSLKHDKYQQIKSVKMFSVNNDNWKFGIWTTSHEYFCIHWKYRTIGYKRLNEIDWLSRLYRLILQRSVFTTKIERKRDHLQNFSLKSDKQSRMNSLQISSKHISLMVSRGIGMLGKCSVSHDWSL